MKELESLNNNICPNCGNMLESIRSNGATIVKCPKCSWSIVSSEVAPEYEDSSIYEIYLDQDPECDKEKMKVIAKICNWNYIETIKNLEVGGILIFKGVAYKVRDFKKKLDDNGIKYHISPNYKY